MKKIGIITLNGESNYGNRLQNYALQNSILELNYSSETVILRSSKLAIASFVKGTAARMIPIRNQRLDYWRMQEAKGAAFRPFSQAYIKSRIASGEHEPGLSRDYDLLITGSDQVWNPKFAGKDLHFLTFAPKEKRVSYAASFGVSDLSEEQGKRYARLISEMKHVSVREEAGVDIVKCLTGRDASLVPDPTMLLEREQWDGLIEGYAHLQDENYVVIYTLHNLSNNHRSQVESYAKDNGCRIYQIMGDFYDPSHEIPDPAEFVARIKYAKAVFTDSFHCCVFSTIYHTPFVVFDRTDGQNMSSRLVTLTGKFKLEQAMASGDSDIVDILSSEDFSQVDKIMADYRRVGLDFLKNVLRETVDE